MTPLEYAWIGLILVALGLVILLGRNKSKKLEALINKRSDGVDDWQSEIHESHKRQRHNQVISGFLIVIGIAAQTFPAYYPEFFLVDSQADNTPVYTEA